MLYQMEVKLFKVCKRLQFLVDVRGSNDEFMMNGVSVEFGTHNSGTPGIG
jgi:hypothetical protein